ncbi:MAG: DUF1294 domain-containing protein [Streptococcaceae bacterium]|nr:DUF1294 domain-containing protein [Streptococcaceae bacterium]
MNNLLLLLFIWNLIVFITYGIDKYKAVHHLWRIPERVLLIMAILAGGLGALLAGKTFHHKTRKAYFWMTWVCGILVIILIVYLLFKWFH